MKSLRDWFICPGEYNFLARIQSQRANDEFQTKMPQNIKVKLICKVSSPEFRDLACTSIKRTWHWCKQAKSQYYKRCITRQLFEWVNLSITWLPVIAPTLDSIKTRDSHNIPWQKGHSKQLLKNLVRTLVQLYLEPRTLRLHKI